MGIRQEIENAAKNKRGTEALWNAWNCKQIVFVDEIQGRIDDAIAEFADQLHKKKENAKN